MITSCQTCGQEHVSRKGNPLSHAQWERNELLKVVNKKTQIKNGETPDVAARGEAIETALETDEAAEKALRARLQWVYDNMDAKKPTKPAAKGDWGLLNWSKDNKDAFYTKYLAHVGKNEKPDPPEDEPDEAVESNIALIEEWFRERQELCPHCGRGPSASQGS
jgi:hypothetical protein